MLDMFLMLSFLANMNKMNSIIRTILKNSFMTEILKNRFFLEKHSRVYFYFCIKLLKSGYTTHNLFCDSE